MGDSVPGGQERALSGATERDEYNPVRKETNGMGEQHTERV